MRLLCLFITCSLFIVAGCNGPAHTTTATTVAAPAPKEPVSSNMAHEGTTLVLSVMDKYYGLKNALVATRADSAAAAAAQMVVMAGILQRYAQTDTVHGAALKPYMDTIITQGRNIAGIKDETCERQRIAFGNVSSAVYGMIKNAGLKNAGIFHEYCPMAFNEKGAFWLSDVSEIKNPYFGKKMLECGEVTDSL